MKTHIPPDIYLFDYRGFFLRASVVAAVSVIIYSMLFGISW